MILDELKSALATANAPELEQLDDEPDPQQPKPQQPKPQQSDPGSELRKLAQQYGRKSEATPAGLIEAGNIDLTNRPRVKNPDGTTSTVRSMSFEDNGREILVPTVSDEGRILSNDDAIAQYRKSGKHLGIFGDATSATAYAQKLHEQQAAALNDTADPGVQLRAIADQYKSMTKMPYRAEEPPVMPAASTSAVQSDQPGPFAAENAAFFKQPTPPPAVRADASAVATPLTPRTGMSHAQALGLDDKSLPGRVANAIGGMAAHPGATAVGMITAPVQAAITLSKASAELDTRNAIEQSGGDPSSVEMTVTPKEAAIAAAQLGTLALGPELEALVGKVAAPFIGTIGNKLGPAAASAAGRAATIAGRGAIGAGAGAVFMPDDPLVGAILGGAAGAAHAGATGARVEAGTVPIDERVPLGVDRQIVGRTQPKPEATARVEPEPSAPGAAEPDFTVESTNSPGDALAELAQRYGKGKGVTPRETAPGVPPEAAPAATPSGPLAALTEALRAARMKTAEVIAPELGAERRAANRAATTDAMTGLGNQRAYEGAVKGAEADPKTSVIRFDLNGFKNVNDVHGHEAGDAALKSVAGVIRQQAKGLPAFRVGGDEFALFAPAADAARIRDAIEEAIGVQQVFDPMKTLDNLQNGKPMASAKYSISGGVGNTNAEADAAAMARKAEHKKAQGIGGRGETQSSPDATPRSTVRSEPLANLDVEPERFQYKLNTNEKGVGRELENVKAFNPDLAGVVAVWRDPADGRLKVVNGHHRVDLARRNNVPAIDVREINAPDAQTARATGAIINIAEGRGTAVDAAKMFRDSGMSPADLEARGVSLTGQVAKDGLALSKLHPKVFDDVVAGRMPVQRAAVIGASGLEPEQQLALTNMLEQREAKGRKMTNDGVSELIRFVKQAGSATATQESLFGAEEMTRSLAPEKAELSAYIKEKLGKDRRLFGFLTKGSRAEHIEGAGAGKIETQRASELAGRAAQAEEVYNKLSTMGGPVSDALNHAAREWVRGGDRNEIRAQLYQAIVDAVRAVVGGAEGPRSEGSAPTSEGNEPAGEPSAVDERPSLFGDIVSHFAREPENERQPPSDRLNKDATTPSGRSRSAATGNAGGRRSSSPAERGGYRAGERTAGEGPVRSGTEGSGEGGRGGAESEGAAAGLSPAEAYRREMERRGRTMPRREDRPRSEQSPALERPESTDVEDELPPPPDKFAPSVQRARLANTKIVDADGQPLVVYYHTASPSDDPKITSSRVDYNAPHMRRSERVSGSPEQMGWTYESARQAMIDSGAWTSEQLAKMEKPLAAKQRYRPAYKGLSALVHILERERNRHAGPHEHRFHPPSWWQRFEGLVEAPPGLLRPLGIRLHNYDEIMDVRKYGGPIIKHPVFANIQRPLRFPDGGAAGWTYETVRAAMVRTGHWTEEQIDAYERALQARDARVRVEGRKTRTVLEGVDALRALIQRPAKGRFADKFGGHRKGFDGIVFRNLDGAPGTAPLQKEEDDALRAWVDAGSPDGSPLERAYDEARDRRVAHQQKNAVDSWVAFNDDQVEPAQPLPERARRTMSPTDKDRLAERRAGETPEEKDARLARRRDLRKGAIEPKKPGEGTGRRKWTPEQKEAWRRQREERIARGEQLPQLGRPKKIRERDLFGDEVPETKGSAQSSMFSDREGTAASRTLAETERAARAELEQLREREKATTSVVERVKIASRMAELQKLLNRDKKIGEEELRNRATGQGDVFSEIRTNKGRAGMGVNRERLADTMSANVYAGGLAKVIVKEAIQNAIDALRPRGGGTIRIKLDQADREITVSDDGVGMSPSTATGAFLDAFESEKPEGASGGLGIAKAALFRYAEPLRMTTVAEVPVTEERRGFFGKSRATKKVRTTIEGTGRDWVNGDLSVREADVADSTPTGTEYSISIDKKLKSDDVSFFSARDFLYSLQRNSRLKNVRFEISDRSEYPAELHESSVPAEPRAVTDVPGARIEIFLSNEPMAFSFGSHTTAHILNNGYHQFSEGFKFGPNPPEVWVDVHPTVPVTDPSYPFTIDRSKLKDATRKAIEAALEPLSSAKETKHLDELIRAIAEAPAVDGGGKIIATDASVPSQLAEQIAARPYAKDIVAWWKNAGEAIYGAVSHSRTMPEPQFTGVGLGGSYLAVNIQLGRLMERAQQLGLRFDEDKRNVLLINPFNIVLEARTMAGVFADDAEYLADQMWGALVHEIAHQNARGHDVRFTSEFTRIDGRAARVQARFLADLDKLWHRLLDDDTFQQDVDELEKNWKSKTNRFEGFYGHDQFERSNGADETSEAVSRFARERDDTGDDLHPSARADRGRASSKVPGGTAIPGGGGGSAAQPGSGGPGVSGANAGAQGPALGGAPRRHPMPEPAGLGAHRPNVRPLELIRKVKAVFIPESLGKEGKAVAGTIRHETASRFRAYTQAVAALRDLQEHIEKQPRDRQVELWDAYENGRDTGDAFVDAMNKVFREVTDERTQELIKLDRLKAERAIENYIGRFWSIENGSKRAVNFLRSIFGKRPYEGPKSFLKQRSREYFVEGLDAGLVPATYNYVESQLAKIAEMERLIGAEHMLRLEQEQGRAKPVMIGAEPPIDADGEQWVRIDREGNDPAFSIWAPPEVTHWEGVDAIQFGKLRKLLQDLGIKHERKLNIGDALGYAKKTPEGIVTKFGGPEGTLMHELGHILDFRYDLKREILRGIGRSPTRTAKKGKKAGKEVPDYKRESPQARDRRQLLRDELRNLANLRVETMSGVPLTKDLKKQVRQYLHAWPEKMANMVEAYISVPDRFRRVAPGIYEIFDRVVDDYPELHPLRDMKPSLARETHEVQQRLPGPVLAGHWYAPRNAAAVWQNHLSRGLRGNPIYDAALAPGAAATQVLLGISGFHGTVIATEGLFSDMVLAAEQAMSGKPGAAVKALGRSVATPTTTAVNAAQSILPRRLRRKSARVAALAFGHKVMEEYTKPGSHPELADVLQSMIAGGFRGTSTSELWSGERAGAFKRAMRQAIHGDTALRKAWGASKIPLDALFAGVELLSSPLMSRYVPLMKTAATYHAVGKRLEELPPNISDGDLEREMWDVVKEMDFRFGQVIYDNYFINNVAKHLAQALFMAPGWTFGTLALMARGARDVGVAPKRLYDRARGKAGANQKPILGRSGKYWVAAVVGTAILNGLLTYFNSGEMPGTGEDGDWWKDFFAFRDGTYDINGNANRHTIPGYLMHDVYGWTHHPYDTFINKLTPFWAFAARVVRNETSNGDMIWDPEATGSEKAKQIAEGLTDFAPLSVQNYLEARRREEATGGELARNAFGVTPAKREVVRSEAQNMMSDYLKRRGRTAATPDEAQAREDRGRILSGLRSGADVADRITTALERGELTPVEMTRMMRRAGILPMQEQFKSLTIDQALKVFNAATPREQGLFLDILQKKVAQAGRER